jgi:MtN3 and saliva related transmembrane protein
MELLATATTVMGVIMSLAYFLQTYKIMVRKSSADVSLALFAIFTIGSGIWLAYGLSISDFPVTFVNVTAVVGALSVTTACLRYRKRKG